MWKLFILSGFWSSIQGMKNQKHPKTSQNVLFWDGRTKQYFKHHLKTVLIKIWISGVQYSDCDCITGGGSTLRDIIREWPINFVTKFVEPWKMKFVILQCTKNLKGPVEVTQLERQPLLMFLTLMPQFSKTPRKKLPTDFLERRKQLT